MIEEKSMQQLEIVLRRIFTLPVTRTTFRELQSAFMGIARGDQELLTDLLESLLSGQIKPSLNDQVEVEFFQKLIGAYCIPARVAKEVHDRGQFVSFITSDLLTQVKGVVFSNCIKTVEGDELRFATDLESTIQLLQHFCGRLHEAKRVESSEPEFERLDEALGKVKEALNEL